MLVTSLPSCLVMILCKYQISLPVTLFYITDCDFHATICSLYFSVQGYLGLQVLRAGSPFMSVGMQRLHGHSRLSQFDSHVGESLQMQTMYVQGCSPIWLSGWEEQPLCPQRHQWAACVQHLGD